MSKVLTTHTLFEWCENGEYHSQFVNRMNRQYSLYEHKPGVRRTAVSWKYLYPDSLDGFWVDVTGKQVTLPWQVPRPN